MAVDPVNQYQKQ